MQSPNPNGSVVCSKAPSAQRETQSAAMAVSPTGKLANVANIRQKASVKTSFPVWYKLKRSVELIAVTPPDRKRQTAAMATD